MNDSIMSDDQPKFPGHVKIDKKIYEHTLGPDAKWMKNLNILSGQNRLKKSIPKPKKYSGNQKSVIKELRTTLKRDWNPFMLGSKAPKRKTAAEVILDKQ